MTLFHIGALCSKTLNAISRVKKLIKFFNFWFSVMILTQTMRKSCIWYDFFSLGGQYYGLGQSIYGSSVGYHASNTSPSSIRGKILRIGLRIFIVLEISHTCKKSCLWHNLQSIWNGVPLRHTHGENRYSEGMGLIGLKWRFIIFLLSLCHAIASN